jgi:hypothetical protein
MDDAAAQLVELPFPVADRASPSQVPVSTESRRKEVSNPWRQTARERSFSSFLGGSALLPEEKTEYSVEKGLSSHLC